MTDKELRRLNRSELLQILLEQSIEIEKLQQQLDAANAALAKRELEISESGTLAEAALRLNQIFADADAAAALYLENIRRMADAPQQPAAVDATETEQALPLDEPAEQPPRPLSRKERRKSRRKHEG